MMVARSGAAGSARARATEMPPRSPAQVRMRTAPGLNFRTVAAYCLSGSLSRDGKSIATTVFNTKSDIWILEGFPQPRHGWFSRN